MYYIPMEYRELEGWNLVMIACTYEKKKVLRGACVVAPLSLSCVWWTLILYNLLWASMIQQFLIKKSWLFWFPNFFFYWRCVSENKVLTNLRSVHTLIKEFPGKFSNEPWKLKRQSENDLISLSLSLSVHCAWMNFIMRKKMCKMTMDLSTFQKVL